MFEEVEFCSGVPRERVFRYAVSESLQYRVESVVERAVECAVVVFARHVDVAVLHVVEVVCECSLFEGLCDGVEDGARAAVASVERHLERERVSVLVWVFVECSVQDAPCFAKACRVRGRSLSHSSEAARRTQ